MNYSHTVQTDGKHARIAVTRHKTGEVKEFFIACGAPGSVRLSEHMASLTDRQNLKFFEKRRITRLDSKINLDE